MPPTTKRRSAIRTPRGWAISVLQEAGAIRECEDHSWMRDCRNRRTAAGGAESLRRSIATTRISNESDLADMSTYRVTAMEMRRRLTGSPADIAE
jgi:hypothetical protein